MDGGLKELEAQSFSALAGAVGINFLIKGVCAAVVAPLLHRLLMPDPQGRPQRLAPGHAHPVPPHPVTDLQARHAVRIAAASGKLLPLEAGLALAWLVSFYTYGRLPRDPSDSPVARYLLTCLSGPWTLLTCLFIHKDRLHLVTNIMHLFTTPLFMWISDYRYATTEIALVRARTLLALFLQGGLLSSLATQIHVTLEFARLGRRITFAGASGGGYALQGFFVAQMQPLPYSFGRTCQQGHILLALVGLEFWASWLQGAKSGTVAHLVGLATGYWYGRKIKAARDEGEPGAKRLLEGG